MNPVLEAWKAAFGDISDLNWDTTANEQASLVPVAAAATTKTKSRSKKPSALESSALATFPSSQAASSLPINVRPVTSVIAPHIAGTVFDSERMQPIRKRAPRKKPAAESTLTTSTAFTSPSANLPVPASFSSSLSDDDALSFILDSFDSMIAPHIQNPPGSSPADIALRRHLYRKQFNLESFKLLHSLHEPIISVEQLIPLIHSACAKCNIVLV